MIKADGMLCLPGFFEARYTTVIGSVWERCVEWRGVVTLRINLNPHWHSTVLLPLLPTKSLCISKDPIVRFFRLLCVANVTEQGFKGWHIRERLEYIFQYLAAFTHTLLLLYQSFSDSISTTHLSLPQTNSNTINQEIQLKCSFVQWPNLKKNN